jgi:hypothetical protein
LLLTQRAYAEGARAVAYWVGLMLDIAKLHPDPEQRSRADALVSLVTPIVKAMLTEIGFNGANLALQVFGGHGYISEFEIEQHVRDSRAGLIYEGTNEIQAIDLLLRKVLANRGVDLEVLLQLIDGEAKVAAALPRTRHFGERLALCASEVRDATSSLIRAQAVVADAPYRVASDYLGLLGHCVFAWFWAWSARIAAAHGEAAGGFYRSKLATASYYFDYVLPKTAYHLAVIRAAAAPLEWPVN